MIDWKIKNNVISELILDGDNIIYPWGIETADSSAFFSLERNVGYRYEVINSSYNKKNNLYEYKVETKMFEGGFVLTGKDYLKDNLINRKVSLECLEDSFFMDFVMRYRFKKEFFQYAVINNKIIEHKCSNIYFQYPVKTVSLIGEKYNISIKIIDYYCSEFMNPYMYVRDHEDEWVVHVRMIPINWEKIVIKLCNNWYKTKPLPQRFSNIILKSNRLKQYLLYHNEKTPYNNCILKIINPNAFPMIKLCKGSKIKWDVNLDIVTKDNK